MVFFTSPAHFSFAGMIESFGCVHIMFQDEFDVIEHVPSVYFGIKWVPVLFSSPERCLKLKIRIFTSSE